MLVTLRSNLQTAVTWPNIRSVIWQTIKKEFRFIYSDESHVLDTVANMAVNIFMAGFVIALSTLVLLFVFSTGDKNALALTVVMTGVVYLVAAERVAKSAAGVIGFLITWTLGVPALALLAIARVEPALMITMAWVPISNAFCIGFGCYLAFYLSITIINLVMRSL